MYTLPAGLSASDITSAKCTITPATGSATELTFSGTDTSVISTSDFSPGSYTTSVTIVANSQTYEDVDQTVVLTTGDKTSSHTLTNTGPFKVSCSFTSPTSYTSATCTVTPGSSGSGSDTLTFGADTAACTGGTCTVTSGMDTQNISKLSSIRIQN